jgi:hypothetical protein
MSKKKPTRGKAIAAKKTATKKKPTTARRQSVRPMKMPPVPIIPEAELSAHFAAVEAAVRDGSLNVREDILDDPRKRTTILVHVLLAYRGDRLAGRPPESVFWTRWYWHHRLCRMHEQLEHGGNRCDAEREREDHLIEDSCEVDADWDVMKQVEAVAEADADAALGPGPFKRPKFACGDIRPLRQTEEIGETGADSVGVLNTPVSQQLTGTPSRLTTTSTGRRARGVIRRRVGQLNKVASNSGSSSAARSPRALCTMG